MQLRLRAWLAVLWDNRNGSSRPAGRARAKAVTVGRGLGRGRWSPSVPSSSIWPQRIRCSAGVPGREPRRALVARGAATLSGDGKGVGCLGASARARRNLVGAGGCAGVRGVPVRARACACRSVTVTRRAGPARAFGRCGRGAAGTERGSIRLGWTRIDSDGLGWTRMDSDQLGWTRMDSDQLGSTRIDSDRLGSTRIDSDRLGSPAAWGGAAVRRVPLDNAGTARPPGPKAARRHGHAEQGERGPAGPAWTAA